MAGLRTPLCDLLGIEYPIVLAGMATGTGKQSIAPTPVELVAAVSNAGGLGVMGYGFSTPQEFDQGIRKLRTLTDRPFGVDFMVPAKFADVGEKSNREIRADIERDYPKHVAFVKTLMEQFNLSEVEVLEKYPGESEAMIRQRVEVMLDNRVPVFACATGDPPKYIVDPAHAQGMLIIGMCGAVRHAARQVAAGSDIITAQGTEAGGHTGNIATFVLVSQIVDYVTPRPVLAAGGIGSGRHVAAALALGAQGVWVGTAFLASEETNIYPSHQESILGGRSEQFTASKFGDGMQARSFDDEVKRAWEASGLRPLGMPLMGILNEPLNEAARQTGRLDLVSNSAGQIAGMIKERRPAKDILMSLVEEAEETIERLQSNLGARAR
ncbi:MAG: nitronate monooxygenase family protein [Chloroflexi bacterium]|nr:nitronate monooxygenase family protein [Chloroflexota bacterium]